MISLLQRIRPRRVSSRPRWRYARSGPHKAFGVERRFFNQASGTPFDCQAISISPLANLIDRSARFRLCSTNRYAAKGSPLAANLSPRRSTAQAILASLLANATTTTLGWARLKQRFGPSAERRVALGDIGQRRSRAVDQQLAKISVAALADAEKLRFAAGRELTRNQTQPRRQVATVARRSRPCRSPRSTPRRLSRRRLGSSPIDGRPHSLSSSERTPYQRRRSVDRVRPIGRARRRPT